MSDLIRILGVDPGSRVTGFGFIEVCGGRAAYLNAGCIRTQNKEMPPRLAEIFKELGELIETHRPAVLAIERVFMHRNADSALKLGQARGAAIVAAVSRGLEVFEYAPNEIKQAVVGKGHADKTQVQHMVKVLLKLPCAPQADAADALAAALCHAHTQHYRQYLQTRRIS